MWPVGMNGNELPIFVKWCIVSNIPQTKYVLAGKLRYANNSNYKNDVMIRKEVICNYKNVIAE